MRDTPKGFVTAYNKHGSLKAVARNEGVGYTHARSLYKEAVAQGLMAPLPVGRKTADECKNPELRSAPKPEGRVKAMRSEQLPLPPEGKISRYLFTSAQNDTLLHKGLWDNLHSLLAYYRDDERVHHADLYIARLTYVKAGLGARGDKAAVIKRETLYGGTAMNWVPEIEPYLCDKRVEVAPGLVWCGEVNILPTAERPLSGFESYTGRKSGIFPHTKVALESIASMADEGTKFNYTTGALTLRNHIQRKAGLKADFHHSYGALLVEVNSEGRWWVRQLNADSEGTIYDFDIRVKDANVEIGDWVDTVVCGDIHTDIIDGEQFKVMWREGGVIDRLKPRRQIFHDLFNFGSGRGHHDIKDPVIRLIRHRDQKESVEQELLDAAEFLRTAEREWCETVVVNSNHDRHIGRWLKEQDARLDPVNLAFWTELWAATVEVIQETGEEPNYLEIAMALVGYDGDANFLPRDASYIICEDENGGIECGLHGDEGPNGSRGNARAFARMGRRMIVGHTHSAGIFDSVYTVGTHSILRPDYTHGPGSWSHTYCITYENGKRALVTIWKGQDRA